MALVNYVDKAGLRFFYRQIKRMITESGMNVVNITTETEIPQMTRTGALAYYVDKATTTIPTGTDCLHLPKKATGEIFILDYCYAPDEGEIVNKYVLFDASSIYMADCRSIDGFSSTPSDWQVNSGNGKITPITSANYELLGENIDPDVTYFITDGNGDSGKIMRGGIEFGGKPVSVEDFSIEISQADYDNLSEEEKNNGKLYFIYDYEPGGNVTNTSSEITEEAYALLPESEKNKDCTFYIRKENGVKGRIVRKGVDYTEKLSDAFVEISQADYDNLSEEEKNNGKLYFILDAPSQANNGAIVAVEITTEAYNALSEAERNNDKLYFITDMTTKESETITKVEISESAYNALSNEVKNNGKLYFIKEDEKILKATDIFDKMNHKGEINFANLPSESVEGDYYYILDKCEGRYFDGENWRIVR